MSDLPNQRITTRDNLYCAVEISPGQWEVERTRTAEPRIGFIIYDTKFKDVWFYPEAAVYSQHAISAIKYLTERVGRKFK
jgi:hypothetical protein